MSIEIKVPSVGESVTEATISEWVKKTGDAVKRDDVVLVLETDKASVEVVAEQDGVLTTTAKEGDIVKVGSTVGKIEPGAGVAAGGSSNANASATRASSSGGAGASASAVDRAGGGAAAGAGATRAGAGASVGGTATHAGQKSNGSGTAHDVLSPAVRRVVQETGVDPKSVAGTGRGGRLTKNDVVQAAAGASAGMAGATSAATTLPAALTKQPAGIPPLPALRREAREETERVPMTTIRRRIAERLVDAQHTAAILTTFNEIDMSKVMALRNTYKDEFKKRYDVSLGFMGFFVKAVIEALRAFPKVNASIEGHDIIYHNYHNIGIAVGTEKGLLVPVLRDAGTMSLAEIELTIKHYALKAREGKITVDDLSGGTFTISNGGVYGSLMSTPILNPPQSGILGMHKIEERPIAVDGQVVVRPMMYVALSYDHRLIDGSESVSFLVRVKECIEDPSRILLEV